MDILYYSNHCKHSQKVIQVLAKNNFQDKINYIWISHEHPDHFSPKDIVNFPKKKNIKIIFQNTKDKRVVSFLKKKGFQIIELENEWFGNDNSREYISQNRSLSCVLSASLCLSFKSSYIQNETQFSC
jgi:metal-dependent hydrolase (beta-lactamase superfamily II)